MRVTIIFLIFLLGCSGCAEHKPVVELGEFAPYVARFEAISVEVGAPVKIEDLVVVVGDIDPDNGFCHRGVGETPVITISRRYWNEPNLTESMREMLVFHELGHCVLKREHDRDTFDGNHGPVPKSVMWPYLPNAGFYEEHRDEYLLELFGVGGGPDQF